MRLGLIIYGSLSTLSGGYLYDRKLVEYLTLQGDQVEIVSLPWQSYLHHLAHNLSPGLFRRLRDATYDLLLQDELNHPSLLWLNRRLRHTVRYPLVSIIHHLRSSELRPPWQNLLYRLVERSYLQSVDGFIFNSQTTRQAVQDSGVKIAQKPSIVAYPAGNQLEPDISENDILDRATGPGPLRLLFLGNLIPRKGLHTLLDALALLPPETCHLNVVGNMQVDTVYAASIRRQVEEHNLGQRVQLYAALSEAELTTQMKLCHLMVVPSTYEGFGIVYLEGMGFGLPAIATTAGAAQEIISHGQDGFLLPPSDPITLAQILAELAQDRQRLASMSLAARRRYLAHPTWEQTAHCIRDFLESIAQQDQKPGFSKKPGFW
jgi:glycosyltransferase involved in cell wall biosynthesis